MTFGCKGTLFFDIRKILIAENSFFLFTFSSMVEQPPTILWSLIPKISSTFVVGNCLLRLANTFAESNRASSSPRRTRCVSVRRGGQEEGKRKT